MDNHIPAWGLSQAVTTVIHRLKKTTLLYVQLEPGLNDPFIAQCMPKAFINSFLVHSRTISFIKKFSPSNINFLLLQFQKITKFNNLAEICSNMAEICSTICLMASLEPKVSKWIPYHGRNRSIRAKNYTNLLMLINFRITPWLNPDMHKLSWLLLWSWLKEG